MLGFSRKRDRILRLRERKKFGVELVEDVRWVLHVSPVSLHVSIGQLCKYQLLSIDLYKLDRVGEEVIIVLWREN